MDFLLDQTVRFRQIFPTQHLGRGPWLISFAGVVNNTLQVGLSRDFSKVLKVDEIILGEGLPRLDLDEYQFFPFFDDTVDLPALLVLPEVEIDRQGAMISHLDQFREDEGLAAMRVRDEVIGGGDPQQIAEQAGIEKEACKLSFKLTKCPKALFASDLLSTTETRHANDFSPPRDL